MSTVIGSFARYGGRWRRSTPRTTMNQASASSASWCTCFQVRIKLTFHLRKPRARFLGQFLLPRQRVYNYICLRISFLRVSQISAGRFATERCLRRIRRRFEINESIETPGQQSNFPRSDRRYLARLQSDSWRG